MLTIKCAACKTKLLKYEKIGAGEVLRCHKNRIIREYSGLCKTENRIKCQCGMAVGIDKGPYYKMIAKAFTCSGTKN